MHRHGVGRLQFEFEDAPQRFGATHETRILHADGSIKKRPYKITLNKNYALQSTKETLTEVLLHEIAHAIVGVKHGHDAVWLEKAIEIGATGNITMSRRGQR